jgi:enoyl-CoA hydratase
MTEELAGGKLILDEPAEAVARLTLNRPDSRNALDHETLNGIAEAMPDLDRGIEVRCVILTGAGGILSAGYDIGGFSEEEFESEA